MYRTTYNIEKKEWSGPRILSIFNPKTSIGNVVLNALDINRLRTARVSLCQFLHRFRIVICFPRGTMINMPADSSNRDEVFYPFSMPLLV